MEWDAIESDGTMIRLTEAAGQHGAVVLKVEGWLVGRDVEFLAREGVPCLRQGANLTLDLAGVRHIDASGISLLRLLAARGVALQGGSFFVRNLLEANGLESLPGDDQPPVRSDDAR